MDPRLLGLNDDFPGRFYAVMGYHPVENREDVDNRVQKLALPEISTESKSGSPDDQLGSD